MNISGKPVELRKPKENEKERNDNQQICTLQQEDQDLQNEICMLQDQKDLFLKRTLMLSFMLEQTI